MSKGDWRRPSSVPKDEYDQKFEAVFGPKKLNVMSDEDRQGLRGENETGGHARDMPDDAKQEKEGVGQEQSGSVDKTTGGTG